MAKYSIVFVTTSNIKEAKIISNALLQAKLAACVNLLKGIESLFWWQGKLDAAKEVLLVIKTRKKFFLKICKLVKKLHSYQTPEIISFSLEDSAPDYRRWLNASISKSA